MRIQMAPMILIGGAALCASAIVAGLESSSAEVTFAVVPSRVWLEDGRKLDKANQLLASPIYLFRSGKWEPLPWSPDPKRSVGLAVVSPAGGIVAVSGTGPFPASESTRGGPVVSVVSLSGRSVREFFRALDFAWSPDGSQLALVFGPMGKDGPPIPERIGIWNVAKDSLRTFDLPAHHLAWRDAATLLLDYWTHISALDVKSGRESRTTHRGVNVSPDGKYSISIRPEGSVHVWDDGSGKRLTVQIEGLLDGARVRTETPPYWSSGTAPGHLLNVPTCKYFDADSTGARKPAECSLFVIDVTGPTLLRRVRGQVLSNTPGAEAALILDKGVARVARPPGE